MKSYIYRWLNFLPKVNSDFEKVTGRPHISPKEMMKAFTNK
ncbi:hypothetical protein [Flavobacterium sp. ASW18X]|nr:hypothetical protein [Flavobacterium sp. ASW18X]